MALYPVGKAQKQVLEALGRGDIQTFQGAEDFFESIGISVTAKREGRASVPVVSQRDSTGGGFNAYGEGETWDMGYKKVDLSPLSRWMKGAQ